MSLESNLLVAIVSVFFIAVVMSMVGRGGGNFYVPVLAWGVTPVVLYITYILGANRWKMEKSLALLIASATSVCGVSAAIAMAAASKAKKEHLTVTISMSLIFTVLMLVGMPLVIKSVGISQLVGVLQVFIL